MSRVFVDTSGLLAFLVPSDRAHPRAVEAFGALRDREAVLVTSSYVLCEMYALLAGRHGLEEVREFREGMEPLLEVSWVDRVLHARGLDLLETRGKEGLSLVDAVSFSLMRAEGLEEAFAFDPDFEDEGFRLLS